MKYMLTFIICCCFVGGGGGGGRGCCHPLQCSPVQSSCNKSVFSATEIHIPESCAGRSVIVY